MSGGMSDRHGTVGERHLTVDELADRLRVKAKTIYKWNYKGTGPRRIKVGRCVRYRLRDVVAWESKNQVKS